MTEREEYIKNVEKRIKPQNVVQMINNMNKLAKLPQRVQNYIVEKNNKPNQYMGFVVEPYSLFFAYEIDEKMVSDQLPPYYRLIKTSMFEEGEKKFCAIIGCFNIHTSVFWGSRFELYVIAENTKTGMISWIIFNCQSNTFNFDPKNGFQMPTAKESAFTTSFDEKIICDLVSEEEEVIMSFYVDISQKNKTSLDQRLWIEGNLSVDYAGELGNEGKDPFGLIFFPEEMECAQRIGADAIYIEKMQFGFITEEMKPFEVCCFPYAQHYLTTVFPQATKMRGSEDLRGAIKEFLSIENN